MPVARMHVWDDLAQVATGGSFCAVTLAATEAVSRALGYPNTDIWLAAERGFIGGGSLVTCTLAQGPHVAVPPIWEFMMIPAATTAVGAVLLHGIEHLDAVALAQQTVRLALIGSPVWVGLWCGLKARELPCGIQQSNRLFDEPAPPYTP